MNVLGLDPLWSVQTCTHRRFCMKIGVESCLADVTFLFTKQTPLPPAHECES